MRCQISHGNSATRPAAGCVVAADVVATSLLPNVRRGVAEKQEVTLTANAHVHAHAHALVQHSSRPARVEHDRSNIASKVAYRSYRSKMMVTASK